MKQKTSIKQRVGGAGRSPKKNRKIKVLVAMSGGVDSSVAALLMKQKGYEVIGAFMKNWSDTKNDLGECTWKQDRQEAIKIASLLKIPLITLDFEKEYRKLVVDEMFKLYKKGITPNPDIDCNQKIKFPLLRKAAKKLGAEFVVTGHYVRIKDVKIDENYVRSVKLRSQTAKNNKKSLSIINSKNKSASDSEQEINYSEGRAGGKSSFRLLRAKDETKDQSYFLYRLNQEDLKHSLFPIGDYTKKQIREIAKKHKFPNAERKGTVGICFIGKVNLKKFLQKKIKPKKGKILNPEREQIGEHDGIYYYTIGQKIGPHFGIDILKKGNDKKQLKRWYIARKNLRKNEIIAAPEGHKILYRKEITIKQPHWINDDLVKDLFGKKDNVNKIRSMTNVKDSKVNLKLAFGRAGGTDNIYSIKLHARIRQVGELLPCKLTYNKTKKQFKVTLRKPITGVSEGQAIVLYKGKETLGGGVIGF
ncbi:MAG: hypothetical protein KKB79_01505 [Nanoarchaeota archaeon]|nr:hypothetical protein [Nanoarchaeota archaeon]